MKSSIRKYILAFVLSAALLAPGCGASLMLSSGEESLRHLLAYEAVSDGIREDIAWRRSSLGDPFEKGGGEMADAGRQKAVPGSGGDCRYEESGGWHYIDRDGDRLPDYRLLQSIRYGYADGSIMAAEGADKEQCLGIHEYQIRPVLTELASCLNGEKEAERMADEARYCNVRYCLDVPGTAADSLQEGNTRITVDLLSFDNGASDFKRCLNVLKEEEYRCMEYMPVAPEQCLVFMEEGKLVVVWCSLFRGGQEAVKKVREILEVVMNAPGSCGALIWQVVADKG